jgi:hypothetical protein
MRDQYGRHIPKLVGLPAMSQLQGILSDDDFGLAVDILDNMEWYEDEHGNIFVPNKSFTGTQLRAEIYEICPSFYDLNNVTQRRYRGEIRSVAFSLHRYNLVDGFYHA